MEDTLEKSREGMVYIYKNRSHVVYVETATLLMIFSSEIFIT